MKKPKPVFRCHCAGAPNAATRLLLEVFRCAPLHLAAKLGLVTFIEHDGRTVTTFAEDAAARAAGRA